MPAATAEPPVVAAPPPSVADTTKPDMRVPTALDAPKAGSAREQMRAATNKKYGLEEPAKPDTTRPGETTPRKEQETLAKPEATEEAEETTPPEETKPPAKPEAKPGEKKNPWKMYREEKERADKLERQISEAKPSALAEQERTEYLSRIEKLEARQKEAENELRFRAYEKSDEFISKYETPYNEAWKRHTAELNQVPITLEDGTTRAMQPGDILDLVNLSLPDARALAKQKWGDFADDAMSARKEIRTLFEARTKALDDAKANGETREKEFRERSQKWQSETTKFIGEKYKSYNDAALKDPNIGEFLNPVEGDTKRNELLTKGFAFVDKAYTRSPMDSKLTPAEREEVVRDHARVRNRAAAYGPMKYELGRLRAEVAALKKANGEFKESTPPTAGGTGQPSTPQPMKARDAMRAAGAKHFRKGVI